MTENESKPQRYRIGDLELDSGTVTLSRDGEEIALPQLTFDLLHCLARHAPNVVSTDTLMDEVWPGLVINDETVKQRIKLLRRALADSSSNPRYVASVRGKGYRLVAEVSMAGDRKPQSVRLSSRRTGLAWFVTALILIGLAASAWVVRNRAEPDVTVPDAVTPSLDIRRVAVLPFQNFSAREEDEYLADGITEDIISALARVSDLGVIARTTVMHYKDSGRRVRDIAQELRVGTILEGSIQRFDDHLRITVQMIDAASEEHYWARSRDVGMSELAELQTEVATSVAKALEATISGAAAEALRRETTDDPEAYDAYLKGRAAYRRWTAQHNETALAFYRLAVEKDPEFALAIAGIANSLALRAVEFGRGPEHIDSAREQAERALQLSPGLPEALKALGIVSVYAGRYQQALDDYRKALAVQPNYDEAIFNMAEIFQLQGRWDESVRYQLMDSLRPQGLERLSIYLRNLGLYEQTEALVKQVEKDIPLSFFSDQNRSLHALLNGKPESARQLARHMQQSFPEFSNGWVREAEIDILSGRPEQARDLLHTAVSMAGPYQNYAWLRLAQLHLLAGEGDEARRLIDPVEEFSLDAINSGHEGWFHRWNLAFIFALKGDAEAALSWFERAVDSGRRRWEWDEQEPAFEPLRGKPRFQAALQRQREMRLEMLKNALVYLQEGKQAETSVNH